MELLKNCCHKVHIHFVTFLYLGFAFIIDYEARFLSALTIACIHELCHLLMAYYFHFQIEKIEILPFGAYLSLKDFYFHPIKEELCVVIAGPCSHLFIDMIITFLFKGEFYDYLKTMNLLIFLFNLMPIYPLDGHRVLCLLLQSVLDLKEALYFSLKISIFSLIILGVCYCEINTIVLISFLCIQQFSFYRFIPQYLRLYYSRINIIKKNKRKKFHYQAKYRRGYHNYYFINSSLYDETQIVHLLLKNIKQK